MCVFMWSTLTFTGRPVPRVVRQSMVIRGAKKKDAKAANDNRANQLNPNHREYKGKNGKKKSKSKPGAASMNHKTSVKTNNRANQKNPNNDQHQKSRRHSPIPSNQKQKVAKRRKGGRKAAAAFGQKNNRNPTGRLNTEAFHQSEKALHDVVPRAQLLKTGSRLKGTATEQSDWDYHIKTKEPMTRVQRDRIYRSLQSLEGSSAIEKVSCKNQNPVFHSDAPERK